LRIEAFAASCQWLQAGLVDLARPLQVALVDVECHQGFLWFWSPRSQDRGTIEPLLRLFVLAYVEQRGAESVQREGIRVLGGESTLELLARATQKLRNFRFNLDDNVAPMYSDTWILTTRKDFGI
jgi:hypothetical protein